MPWLRRGGRATLVSGERLVWSTAEGVRGTRCREAISTAGGELRRSLLLEISPTRTVTRLELSTAAGLLTLHPGPDGSSLHGNVVTPGGIRHLTFDWSPDHVIVLPESPILAELAVEQAGPAAGAGGQDGFAALRVDDALEPRPERWRVQRRPHGTWELRSVDSPEVLDIRLDPTGSTVLRDARAWPLED